MTTQAPRVSKVAFWIGCIMSALPILLLLFGAVMALIIKPPEMAKGMDQMGIPQSLAFPLGIIELACAVIYAIPQTSVLGAILMTGFFGGTIITHLRLGQPVYIQSILGVLVWGGLFLRDRRLRVLIPFRLPSTN
jgi:hypothetical protein